MDFPYSQFEVIKRQVRGAVLSRAARLPGIVAGTLADGIAHQFHSIQTDIGSVLKYLSELPEHAKKVAAYDFFSAFFTHYLPKKFLRHYIFESGSPPSLVLSEQEMIDCNPYITVMNCAAFRDALAKASLSKGLKPSKNTLALTCPAGALTNGTLGQFTVRMNATLTFSAADKWLISGKMSFYDEWDFDPKDFSTGGRSFQGEIKTRFAHYALPGKSFTIESVEAEFLQSSSDAMIVWKGGIPAMAPDRIAGWDLELKKHE